MAHKSRIDKNEFNSTFQFHGTLSIIFNTLTCLRDVLFSSFERWKFEVNVIRTCIRTELFEAKKCTENSSKKIEKCTQIKCFGSHIKKPNQQDHPNVTIKN